MGRIFSLWLLMSKGNSQLSTLHLTHAADIRATFAAWVKGGSGRCIIQFCMLKEQKTYFQKHSRAPHLITSVFKKKHWSVALMSCCYFLKTQIKQIWFCGSQKSQNSRVPLTQHIKHHGLIFSSAEGWGFTSLTTATRMAIYSQEMNNSAWMKVSKGAIKTYPAKGSVKGNGRKAELTCE